MCMKDRINFCLNYVGLFLGKICVLKLPKRQIFAQSGHTGLAVHLSLGT
jgi:hypothetical protein